MAALPKTLVTINRQLRLLTRLLHDLRAGKVTRATVDGLGRCAAGALYKACSLIGGGNSRRIKQWPHSNPGGQTWRLQRKT